MRKWLAGARLTRCLLVLVPALRSVDAEAKLVHVALFDFVRGVLQGAVALAALAELEQRAAHLQDQATCERLGTSNVM